MPRPSAQPGSPTSLRLRFLVSLVALALSGCQGISGTAAPQIRIIVASPNLSAVDLYAGVTPIAYNLAFGNVTSYIALAPGPYTIAANTAGTRQVLTAANLSATAATQYTVLLGDTAANLQQTVLKDQTTPAPAGKIALRFLDQATATGPVDVYLVPSGSLTAALSPILTSQTLGANSAYLVVPAGAYRIVLYPSGASPSTSPIPLHTGALVNYPAGTARTILLLDQRLTGPTPHTTAAPTLQLVNANDFDPSG